MSSDSENSASESSGEDFDMDKFKPRKEVKEEMTSSLVESEKKKRRIKSPENKQHSKIWSKPKLTGECLLTLALFQFQDERASTKDIRELVMEEFPHFKSQTKTKLDNFVSIGKRGSAVFDTGEKDGSSIIYKLNSSKCDKLKPKLEKGLVKNSVSIKESMAHPERFEIFLQNVRNFVCTKDLTAELKPSLSVLELVLETFGTDFGILMTVNETVSKLGTKYAYYTDSGEQKQLKNLISACLRQHCLFSKVGEQIKNTTWKLDASKTGLCHFSRISLVPKPIQILIENSRKLLILGNPSGKVANCYFEEDDPTLEKNSQSLKNITFTTDGSPGKFKIYVAWMTCLDPKACEFGEECFHFIFGHSDMHYSSVTQSKMSTLVEVEFRKRKPLLSSIPVPAQPIDLDDEESGFDDCSILGQGNDLDSSDDEKEPFDKVISDSEPDSDKGEDDKKEKKKPGQSCKGPLDFMLQYPNHEFSKENCLTLWTTNNRKLKRPLKNFLRGAYNDMSKAKGMYLQMTREVYELMESLRIALPLRKKYIIRAKTEGRLSDEPTPPTSSSSKNVNIEKTQEELDKLTVDRRVITKGEKGETVIITIK